MSAKRRAGAGGSPDFETPAAKKPKINDDGMPAVETPETTTTLGLKLVRSLKSSCDKAYVTTLSPVTRDAAKRICEQENKQQQ
ncbi:MAG: hypothetical protein Q9160_002495 [Pyrenula sp. 1 TL-2023]